MKLLILFLVLSGVTSCNVKKVKPNEHEDIQVEKVIPTVEVNESIDLENSESLKNTLSFSDSDYINFFESHFTAKAIENFYSISTKKQHVLRTKIELGLREYIQFISFSKSPTASGLLFEKYVYNLCDARGFNCNSRFNRFFKSFSQVPYILLGLSLKQKDVF
ncbi:MAG: hypothetical protein HON90_04485, partial [Halobacteriovoraceae bacterium]|nr:hypothetical protein [Halobacteriovoraceae bacterium]